jgi:hypothetical protein
MCVSKYSLLLTTGDALLHEKFTGNYAYQTLHKFGIIN